MVRTRRSFCSIDVLAVLNALRAAFPPKVISDMAEAETMDV